MSAVYAKEFLNGDKVSVELTDDSLVVVGVQLANYAYDPEDKNSIINKDGLISYSKEGVGYDMFVYLRNKMKSYDYGESDLLSYVESMMEEEE